MGRSECRWKKDVRPTQTPEFVGLGTADVNVRDTTFEEDSDSVVVGIRRPCLRSRLVDEA